MHKLLVANRSEIAIRCFRAATELGLRTVAVYSYEDRFSLHRFKADEAFQIGPLNGGEPVRSYLNIAGILAVARQSGVDAIHPGYGFLAENADFARAAEAEGFRFIGPTPEHLEMFGDKIAAKQLAQRAGVPTIPGTATALDSSASAADVRAAADAIGYPLIVKASFGGGGRGMRVVTRPDELVGQAGGGAARSDGRVRTRRRVSRALHSAREAHRGADSRRRSRQSRAPLGARLLGAAPPAEGGRDRAEHHAARGSPARHLRRGRRALPAGRLSGRPGPWSSWSTWTAVTFYFIEVNPRIQVEHTVTEMITGIDLVKSQILVADGHRLHEPPLAIPAQDAIERRGVAMQVRITTEDPDQQFMPDYGRITTYRSPGGFAIRLDGGNGFGGAVITPYFDSLLVKLTTWGTTLAEAVGRSDRALREFRIRGVKTNIAFLLNLLAHPTFASGDATTTFIDDTPELFQSRAPRDRATKILAYLGDVIVNGREDVKQRYDPARVLTTPVPPPVEGLSRPPDGLRQQLLEIGPERLAQRIRDEKRLLITDTTLRDAHQSLLATRVRTYDMLAIADTIAHRLSNLFSVEMWGGATFDTSMRFIQEDPWDRLIELRRRIPNILFQMLLRASNAVGYTIVPRQRRARLHQAERRRRHRRVPDLRLAERHGEHARADRGGARGHARAVRSGDLLYRRHPGSGPHEIQPALLRPAGEGAGRDGHAHAGDQGHGGALHAVRRVRAGEGAAGGSGCADPLPHPRHERDQRGERAARGRRRRRHRRRGDRLDERHDQPAVPQLARQGAAPHGSRHRPRPAGARREQPVLGGRARALLPVRRGAQGAGVRRLSPRDARRPVHELQAAGQEHGARAAVAGSVRCLRRRQSARRRHRQSDPLEQGRRRSGALHGDQQPDGARTSSAPRRRCTSRRASSR